MNGWFGEAAVSAKILGMEADPMALPCSYAANVGLRPGSNFSALRKLQGIFHLDTEVSNGALDLGMAEQNPDGAQIARGLVDDRRLRAPD